MSAIWLLIHAMQSEATVQGVLASAVIAAVVSIAYNQS